MALGLDLREEWLSEAGLRRANVEQVVEKLLSSDIRKAVSKSSLPEKICEKHNVVLEGDFVVQINSGSDISQSLRNLQKAEEMETENEDQGKGENWNKGTKKRILKLELSDGLQTIYAIEHQIIPSMRGTPGEKLLLSNVLVRRGLLLLCEKNTTTLGGSMPLEGRDQGITEEIARVQVVQQPASEIHPNNVSVTPQTQSQTQLLPLSPRIAQTSTQSRSERPVSKESLRPISLNTSQDGLFTNNPVHYFESTQPLAHISTPANRTGVNYKRTVSTTPNNLPKHYIVNDLSNEDETDALFNEFAEEVENGALSPVIAYKLLRDLKDGQTAFVKGFIMCVHGGLKSTTEGGYKLNIEFGDGVGGCICSVESAFVERVIIGLSATEMSKLKKTDKEKYRQIMQQAGRKLQQMEGLFKVSKLHDPIGPAKFVMHDIKEPDKHYASHLLRTL